MPPKLRHFLVFITPLLASVTCFFAVQTYYKIDEAFKKTIEHQARIDEQEKVNNKQDLQIDRLNDFIVKAQFEPAHERNN
jgi:sensor domain CHASE-containing protein